MNIAGIHKESIVDGAGIRLSVFVSGCTRRCPGCFNKEAWDFDYGTPIDGVMAEDIIAEASKPQYDGITIVGGEPFEMKNQPDVCRLIKALHWKAPQKSVWIYTGYGFSDLLPGGMAHGEYTDAILEETDVIVDGPFVEEMKDPSLPFRGSRNQWIIDVKRSLETGQPVISRYQEG